MTIDMKNNMKILLIFSICLFFSLHTSAATLKANISEQTSAQNSAVKSQQRIDQISQQTTDMVHEYQQTSEQLYTLQVYNEQLEKLVRSQEDLIATRNEQLRSIEQTEQAIVPLMLRMIDTLEQFIKLDVPFLLSERQQRVDKLKHLMDQANVTSAEKYRQILEAFLIEIDYGRTIETWQGTHPEDQTAVVNFFRMGRVVLVYQSLDSKNKQGHR